MKYYATPQIIGRVHTVDSEGNDAHHGEKIVTIAAIKDAGVAFEGTISIDVPDYPKKGSNLVIEVSLPELLSAVGIAALNH